MPDPRTRRVLRVHLAHPLMAKLGSAQVVLVDISVLGARVEHPMPLIAGAQSRLAFEWEGEAIVAECRIVRSRIERVSSTDGGLTVYHSGLEFQSLPMEMKVRLKSMIGRFISRALDEQKLNARGVVPQHDVERMPIFRFGGQLTANVKDKSLPGPSALPASRVVRESGYICYHYEHDGWRKKRTHDPGQPANGFTISAFEDHAQAELLCEAYQSSDPAGRRMIQLFAELSIVEGEGISPGRFDP